MGGIGSIMVRIAKPGVADDPVPKDDCYLLIKFVGAQAFFQGSIFKQTRKVVITSQVDLGSPSSNFQLSGIEYVADVDSGVAERLPLKRNLFSLVPATMDTINLKLNFAVDLKNMVAEMAGLVNKGLLSPVLSVVSPAADTAVQKVGQIAGDLIGAFMGGPDQKEDLVHFDGSFNIVTKATRPGYYVLIGSFDKKYPLPTGNETFEFDGQRLLIDQLPADQYSWVALEVQTVRTRGDREGSQWQEQLDAILAKIQTQSRNQFSTAKERRTLYEECIKGLEAVEVLLRADPFYIDREKNAILAKAYKQLNGLVRPVAGPAIAQVAAAVQHDEAIRPKAVRPLALPKLALPGGFRSLQDLDAIVEDYEQSLVKSQEVLRLVKE